MFIFSINIPTSYLSMYLLHEISKVWYGSIYRFKFTMKRSLSYRVQSFDFFDHMIDVDEIPIFCIIWKHPYQNKKSNIFIYKSWVSYFKWFSLLFYNLQFTHFANIEMNKPWYLNVFIMRQIVTLAMSSFLNLFHRIRLKSLM